MQAEVNSLIEKVFSESNNKDNFNKLFDEVLIKLVDINKQSLLKDKSLSKKNWQ